MRAAARAIRNPSRTFLSLNAQIVDVPRLHAKVYIAGDAVIVSSANASANGLGEEDTEIEIGLEAGYLSKRKEDVSAARDWFEKVLNRNLKVAFYVPEDPPQEQQELYKQSPFFDKTTYEELQWWPFYWHTEKWRRSPRRAARACGPEWPQHGGGGTRRSGSECEEGTCERRAKGCASARGAPAASHEPYRSKDRSVVDEFLAERREEVRREDEKWRRLEGEAKEIPPPSVERETQAEKLERARTILRRRVPEGTGLVDEFLAERRAMWGEE
jgi:hypothetical protein